jgi:hypothetical protein
MLRPELRYVDSWVDERLNRCLQLMDGDSASAFDTWVAAWDDLVAFEIVPVIDSAEAAARVRESPRGE